MSVYTAPTLSFIETYVNGAKEMDRKREESRRQMIEGMGNLAKGSVEAYKWQQRKNIADRMEELDAREKELMDELERLRTASPNIDAMVRPGWRGVPFPVNEEDERPKGVVGIYRKELI